MISSTRPDDQIFLKIYPGHFFRSSRDERELEIADQVGFKTIQMVKSYTRSEDQATKWSWVITSTRPLGNHPLLIRLNRVISVFTWAYSARQMHARVLSGHNLIGILIAWLSRLFLPRSSRPVLVYDAHEFTVGLRHGWKRWLIKLAEGFLIRRCVFTIVVNDSIADRVQQMHRLKQRPVVVRSTPSLWPIDEEATRQQRQQFLTELGMPEDTFIIMYHGGVLPNRGVEASIRALQARPNVALIVLGDAEDPAYVDSLKQLARDLKVHDRVLFKASVPIHELARHVGAADVGMILLSPTSENQILTLPNKFFENIQSLTPVIVSDFPEIGSMVRKYDIGLTVDPLDDSEVGAAIEKIQNDDALRQRFKINLQTAKQELTWNNERIGLTQAYRRLLKVVSNKAESDVG